MSHTSRRAPPRGGSRAHRGGGAGPAPDDPGRDANLLGALALAVGDRLWAAGEAVGDAGGSEAVALVALRSFLGGASIDALARVLGLSHSGTVRLVDRLAAAGLVIRGGGGDARAVALRLTPAGRRTARRIQLARQTALEGVLAPLDAAERRRLAPLVEKLLGGLTSDRASARRICRLCDADVCGHPDRCPVTLAVDA